RVAMLLAGRGMRLDSVETAMRQNSICAVHHFAQVYPGQGGAGAGKAVLDFVPRSGYPPGFSRVEIAPRVLGLARKDEAFSPSCAREIGADRTGVVDVAPMLWQRDLPGLPASGALLVRDLGPEANAALIAQFPDRAPYVFHTPTSEADPILVPYDEGMAAIWGAQPAADSVSLAFDPQPSDGSTASGRGVAPRSGRDES